MNPNIYKNNISNTEVAKQEIDIDEGAIKFYLRRPNKQTIIVHSLNPISGSKLLQIAQSKMKVSRKDIVIFYKGQKISQQDSEADNQYFINQGDIIHIHDRRNLEKDQIKITFKPFQCSAPVQELICILVNPAQKIRQSLTNYVPFNKQMSFIESGRKLDLEKSYKQELIEDDSVITITTFLPPIELKISQPITNSQQRLPTKVKAKQYEDLPSLVLPNKALELRKSLSWNPSESCSLISFKKKKKSNIYKSMKMEDCKDVVWQSDGSGEISNKKLRMKIPFRKHKPIQENKYKGDHLQQQYHEESSEDNKDLEMDNERSIFSSQEKIKLKNQFSRLLFSDKIETRQEVTQLQPPQMENFDFMEQTQEVEVGEMGMNLENYQDESDQDQDLGQVQQEQQQEQTEPLADLRQSIGKSRGQYVVPTMIPTRDFDNGNELSDSDQQQI